MYALCMSISCLFSSMMKLRVRKFRDLIDFGLHCSQRVSLILLYFISIRAWVENLHVKNCIKNLMVVMPSYFYKDYKYKIWKSPVKKAKMAAKMVPKRPKWEIKMAARRTVVFCPAMFMYKKGIFLSTWWNQ